MHACLHNIMILHVQSNRNKVAACALHLVHISVDVSYLQRECCVRTLYVVILNSMYYIGRNCVEVYIHAL